MPHLSKPTVVFAAMLCTPLAALASEPFPISGASALRPWVRLAISARADIVCIGDSNQAYAGHGWDHGITRAAANKFGLFATGLHAAGENDGWGAGLGYASSILSTACCVPQFQYAGAPSPLDDCMSPDALLVPMNYLHLPAGQSAGGAANLGLQVWNDSPINVNAHLRYEVTFGVAPGTPGTFQPSIRLGQSPYSSIATAAPVSTSSASWGWDTATIDIPAASRNAALNARFTPWGTDMAGPVVLFTQRMVNLDKPRGAAVSTHYARGSQSARDMALAFQLASDDQLTLFFTRIRASQGASKGVLVRINTGLNDLNEDQPSLGPANILAGNSPEAYADNLLAIVNRVQWVWNVNSWPESELHFLFAVSHPISNPDATALVNYRAAAASLASTLPRTAMLDISQITTADEMLANNWYQSGGADRYHLTQPAYETLAQREIDAIVQGACLADIDSDGGVNTNDLVYILGYFGQPFEPGTGPDIIPDGTINTADLVEFLGTFGQTCPT